MPQREEPTHGDHAHEAHAPVGLALNVGDGPKRSPSGEDEEASPIQPVLRVADVTTIDWLDSDPDDTATEMGDAGSVVTSMSS